MGLESHNARRGTMAVCAATVSVPIEAVKHASREWADDMRWFIVDRGDDGPCVFRLDHHQLLTNGPYVEVVALTIAAAVGA